MGATWAEVTARRLARQRLSSPAGGVAEAVSAMVGAHAQVASAAEIAIGIRTEGTAREDVRAAVASGTLTKTVGPRGTVHLLPAHELGMWLGALDSVAAPTPLLSAGQLSAVLEALAGLLDGADLTLDELDELVVAATGPWAADPVVPAFGGSWPRWRQAVARAASSGVLAYGAGRGQRATYTRAPAHTVPDGAVAQLAHAYLRSYGPALPRELAQWLNAPEAWARSAFEGAGAEPVDVEGEQRWVAPEDAEFEDAAAPGILLLPYFDPYVVGSHPRSVLFPGPAAERALGRGQAGVLPVLLVDGVVGGVWHQKRSGRRIDVTVEPLAPLTARQLAELEGRVERIGGILGGAASLTIGAVTVGPHA